MLNTLSFRVSGAKNFIFEHPSTFFVKRLTSIQIKLTNFFINNLYITKTMGDDSFILMNLKDSKEVAAAMQNDTAQKILDFLTKGKASETIIAKEVGIPMSTAHYNLQQLLKAKLVKADEYHYSKKGKEVLHYKLAKKLIIIAPGGDESNWKELLKKIIPALGITAIIGVLVKAFGRTTNSVIQADFGARIMPVASRTEEIALEAAPMLADIPPQSPEPSFLQQLGSLEWFILGAVTIIAILLIMELIAYKGWFKSKKH
jgi:DNA-binding transcriptional ArsR family regulator